MTGVSALTPLLASQITARVPIADDERQPTPFCTFGDCNNTLSKPPTAHCYTRPASKGVTHYTLHAKCVADFPSAPPSKQTEMRTHTRILFCSFKANAFLYISEISFGYIQKA